jgi:ABC-type antimicrobial peptide transport system permease subunit
VVLLGVAAGVTFAVVAARQIESLLFGVPPTDGTTYLTIAVVLMVAGGAASAIPALRASRVEPIQALRAD